MLLFWWQLLLEIYSLWHSDIGQCQCNSSGVHICCLLKHDVTSVVAVALSTSTLHSALEAVIVSFWCTRGIYNKDREAQAMGREDSPSCRTSEVVSWWTESFSLPHSIWGQICTPVQRMGGVVRTDWRWKTKSGNRENCGKWSSWDRIPNGSPKSSSGFANFVNLGPLFRLNYKIELCEKPQAVGVGLCAGGVLTPH